MLLASRPDLAHLSPAQRLVEVCKRDPKAISQVLRGMTDAQAETLLFDQEGFWLRPNQIPPDEFDTCVALAGRGWGKALALDTPIPTPTGWTTMGELRVGDLVLDDQGRPCRVTFATEVQHGRTCFDVVFSDGSVIVADAEHRWFTKTAQARKAERRRTGHGTRPQNMPKVAIGQVVTTEEIRRTLVRPGDARGERNHSIDVCGALQLPEARLPLDPYVLGVWLGDGHSDKGMVTCADPEIPEMIAAAGFPITRTAKDERSRAITYTFGANPAEHDPVTGRLRAAAPRPDVLTDVLRGMGLLRNKHIPPAYLRASEAQRLALLQGLLDTDGTCSTSGHIEFTTTLPHLADQAHELACSLGIKATLSEGRATLRGVDCGPKFRLKFTAYIPCFRLQRKLARQRKSGAQADRQARRYIVDVRPRVSVPVRCIQVDSPSHLFLCGRTFIPTHNTHSGAAWVNKKARQGARRIALIGPTSADVRDTMIQGVSGILALSPPWFLPRYEPSKRRLVYPNGCIATCYSADKPDRLRGPSCDVGWCDELTSWSHNMEAWEQVKLIMRLGRAPQVYVTTTPKPLKKLEEILQSAVVIRGSTFDNAINLPAQYVKDKMALINTRWGRQELMGEYLADVAGALFKMKWFDDARVDVPPGDDPTRFSRAFALERVVVVVDPAPTANAGSDETGIIVAGMALHPTTGDRHVYILADYTKKGSPQEWGSEVVQAYHRHQADAVVVEVNTGGDFVPTILSNIDPNVPIKQVRAKAGKSKRAEPVSGITEIGRVHLVGMFPDLEKQLKHFSGINGRRDDRADAMCWAVHELALGEQFFFA